METERENEREEDSDRDEERERQTGAETETRESNTHVSNIAITYSQIRTWLVAFHVQSALKSTEHFLSQFPPLSNNHIPRHEPWLGGQHVHQHLVLGGTSVEPAPWHPPSTHAQPLPHCLRHKSPSYETISIVLSRLTTSCRNWRLYCLSG